MNAVVIPVKRLAEAKSRLAPVLPTEARECLVRHLLGRAVESARAAGLAPLAIATPESEVAAAYGAAPVPDRGSLNATLRTATEWARDAGAHGLLILPADLPLLDASAIQALLERGNRTPVVIAPTHDGGTGALLLTPPDAIPPAFGAGSHSRHLRLAHERGLPADSLTLDAFRYDLDTPEDLRRWQDRLPNTELCLAVGAGYISCVPCPTTTERDQ